VASEVNNKPTTAAPITLPVPATPAPRPAASAGRDTGSAFAEELSRGQGAPSSAAAAAASAASAAKPERLAGLKKAVQAQRRSVDDAPVMALLTGRLDKLKPEGITEIVTGNEFLADALSESDVSSFFGKETTVGELLQELGLPRDLVEAAKAQGLDLAQTVTLLELFKALGVDPQRVFAELKLLKDNLGTEGVAGYVQRAKALGNGKASGRDTVHRDVAAERADLPPGEKPKTVTVPTGVATGLPVNGGITGQMTPANGMPGNKAPSIADVAAASGSGAGQARGAAMPASVLGGSAALAGIDLRDFAAAAAPDEEQGLGLDPEALLRLAADGTLGAAKKAEDAVATVAPDQSAAPVLDASAVKSPAAPAADPGAVLMPQARVGEAPALARSTFDSWYDLGTRLEASPDAVRVSGAELGRTDVLPAAMPLATDGKVSAGSFVEQMYGEMLSRGGASDKAAPTFATAMTSTTPSPLMPAVPTTPSPLMAPVVDRGAPWVDGGRVAAESLELDAKSFLKATAGATPVQVGSGSDVSPTSAAGSLGASVAGVAGVAAFGSGDGAGSQLGFGAQGDGRGFAEGGDERGREEGERGLSLTLGGLDGAGSHAQSLHKAASGSHGVSFAGQLAEPKSTEMTPADRANLMQQVIDRATVMSKDGGGVARLDLGSPELGRLELAVKMQDDRLDLKIMTSNDRVRDAMLADLTRLRDALVVQNVKLGDVDVGVGGRQQHGHSGWSGAHQQQHQQQQSGWGWQGSGDGRAPAWTPRQDQAASAVRRVLPPVLSAFPAAPGASSTGRIALRV
jgi:hypothetical protein